MKHSRLVSGIALLMVVGGCTGEAGQLSDSGVRLSDAGSSDPYAPCTDKAKCCTGDNLVCDGDPDTGGVCKCTGLWDCSQNPKKCQQETPVPPGGGTWTCTWTATSYVCKGNPTSKPPGSGGWSCTQSPTDKLWTCTKSPPNPTNKPDGAGTWQCKVVSELGTLVCERDVPKPKTETNCADGVDNDGDGLVDCKDPDCPACPPPACPPGQECCDGIDNDGDGKIDEGNVCGSLGQNEPCPPNAIQSCDCYCGVHRRCKADGTWGPCVVDKSCAPATVTTQSQCGAGNYCDYGKCVLGDPGELGDECVHHNDCPPGRVCDLGYCISDHYVPWKCPKP